MKKYLAYTLLFLSFLFFGSAQAAEITAIDFNGTVIGKVIPDGQVIGLDNNIIGSINADSFVVGDQGKLVGGVVPQGVAIGNDFRVLGRVGNDGLVRTASGATAGKVLPNSLVVNDNFDIIGAVLFPGLIYSDNGRYVGRLSGDGVYTDIKGLPVGFVTPDGYAYRKVVDKYILDGRLISSKMVVSLQGDFLGSMSPGGSVSSFDGVSLGKIRANGFVFNDKDEAVGLLVRTGYAFDNFGRFLGFVNYNGEVSNKNELIGKLSYNNGIINDKGAVIGFFVDSAATATDLKGNYLGRVNPGGIVVKSSEVLGSLSGKGQVVDAQGNVIGILSATGPVFDYKADVVAHSVAGGTVASLGGAQIGFSKGEQMFDGSGKIIGAVEMPSLVLSSDNQIIGVSGISGKVGSSGEDKKVSPYGYVFNGDGSISGQVVPFDVVYNIVGNMTGRISPQGIVNSISGTNLGKIAGFGFVISDLNDIVARTFNALYAVNRTNGLISSDNLIFNNGYSILGKILPDGSVVSAKSATSVDMMPRIGQAFDKILAISFDGSLLGYTDSQSTLKDFSGNNIGYVLEEGIVMDNNATPIGEVVSFGAILDEKCSVIGTLTPRGDVRNYRDVAVGKVLANGQVFSQSGVIIGYQSSKASVIGYNGNVLAYISGNGHAFNNKDESLGCVNNRGVVYKNKEVLAKILKYAPVMSFGNKIIGRTTLDAKAIDASSQVIGYLQANDNISAKTGEPLGLLFQYKYAFDNKNNFMGVVNSQGDVVDGKKEVIAKVHYDGSVVQKNKLSGFAVYDMYVYDEKDNAVGYIALDGSVQSFSGQALGVIKRGFLVDKNDKVLARPARDYYIRNDVNIVIGELLFSGDVVNSVGDLVGVLSQNGDVLDSKNQVIAKAKSLQYYSTITQGANTLVVVDDHGNVIGHVDEFGIVYDVHGKVIAQKNEKGELADEQGNVIGKILDKEKAYDEKGNLIGTAQENGSVLDENGKLIGKLNEKGEVISPNGNIIGGIGKNWYEKVVEAKPVQPDLTIIMPKDQVLAKPADSGTQYRKSLSIALTPDGDYLGDILEDGTVVDKNGKVLGKRQPDGLIMDEHGTLIGIEEPSKKSAEDMFVPAGSFGKGGAYGIGSGPGDMLGAGGGYGPGERYDPQRSAALKQAQDQRRRNTEVGGGARSNYSTSSFDGYQKNWDGVSMELSSWRVDMSEMILADKPIPAVLARSIYSTGTEVPITAYVERNVYSEEGRNIIIPAGSRIIGKVGGFGGGAETNSNASKVDITWERLIRPDGSAFKLDSSITGDAQGRQGALGYLDQQLGKRYTMPVVTSLLTSATSYVMAPSEESTNGESETPRQQAANDARQNFMDSMNKIFEQVLRDKESIKALTFIPAGTRIIVYPKKDLWLRNAEREKDAKSTGDLKGRDILIDEQARNSNQLSSPGGSRGGSSNTGGGGAVVYSNDSGGVQSANSGDAGSVPLISSENPKQNTQLTTRPSAPPPPPPSGSGGTASSKKSGSGSDSAPQLF